MYLVAVGVLRQIKKQKTNKQTKNKTKQNKKKKKKEDSPVYIPNPGILQKSLAFEGGFFTTDPPGKPRG